MIPSFIIQIDSLKVESVSESSFVMDIQEFFCYIYQKITILSLAAK